MRPIKTKRSLAAEITRREGKKSQARMGDVMEILGHLTDIGGEYFFAEMPKNVLDILIDEAFEKAGKIERLEARKAKKLGKKK